MPSAIMETLRRERREYEQELRRKEERHWAEFRKGLEAIARMMSKTGTNAPAALHTRGV